MAKKPGTSKKGPALRAQADARLQATKRDVAAIPVTDVQQLVHELQVRQVELEMQNDELRRTQLELEAARDRYVDLYDFALAGHLTLDTSGTIVESNLRAATLLGLNRQELIGQPLARFVEAEDQGIFQRYCLEVAKIGTRQTCEVQFRNESGVSRWLYLESLAVHEEPEHITHWRTALLDITERKRAGQAKNEIIRDLSRSQHYFHALFNGTPSAVGISTVAEGRLSDVNEGFCRLTGYAREELIGRTTLELGLWADPSQRAIMLQEIQEQGHVHNREGLLRTKSGEIRSLMVSVESIRLGLTPCLIYLGHDITERKRAEEAFRLAKFSMDRAADAVYWIDPQAKILDANEAASLMLGYSKDELCAMTVHELNPDFQANIWPGFWAETRKRTTMSIETFHKAKNGRLIPIEVSVNFLSYEGKEYHCAFVRDITERKQAEEALRTSEERLRKIFECSNDAIFVLDPERDVICQANPKACEMFGYGPDEILATPMSRFHPRDLAEFQTFVRGVLAEGRGWNEFACRTKDGRFVTSEISASTLLVDGRACLLALVRDITDRKQVEVLLAAEKKVLELIATGAAMSEVLDMLMRETEAQSTDGMLGSVLLADETGQRLLHGAAPSLPEAYNAAVHGLVIGPSAGSCGTAAFERKPVFVTDIAADPLWADGKDLAAAHGLGACHSTPILSSQGRLIGTIAMYYRRPHNPGAHDRQLIERATQLAGIAIERRQAEEALRRSEVFITSVVENLPNMVFVKKAKDLTFVSFNKAGEDLLGHSRDTLIGKSDYDFFPKEQADFFTQKDRQVFETGGLVDILEESIETKHQGRRILHTKKIPIYDETDEPQYLLGISEDITERKRVEAALIHSRNLLQSVIQTSPIRVFWKDRESRYLGCNQIFAKDAGKTIPEHVIGMMDYDLAWKEQAELYRADDRLVMESGLPKLDFEEPQTTPDGKRIWLRTSKAPLRDEMNQIIGVLGVYEDITERKRADESLRESEERYRSIFENTVEGIFQTTLDGKYVTVNPVLARMYGYDSPDDMIAAITNIADQLYVDPGRRDEFIRLMQSQKTVTGFEALVYRRDGSFIWISENVRELRDQAGVLVGYEGTVEQITQRKLAEQRLRDTLDQVRMLSGRITTVQEEERTRIARELHDEFGVGLTCLKIDLSRLHTIMGEGTGGRHRKKVGDKIRSMVGQIDTTIASVQRLVAELRPALLDDLGLVAAIEWQCQDFQTRTGITCTCVGSADDITMEPARATALFRICQEALINTARHAQATAVMVLLESWNDSIRLVVTDNGVGIPDTKVSNRHSLGLIGMRERVGLFGGEITIQGHPDKGTTVTACLPRSS